jgi:hypothetical protein
VLGVGFCVEAHESNNARGAWRVPLPSGRYAVHGDMDILHGDSSYGRERGPVEWIGGEHGKYREEQ